MKIILSPSKTQDFSNAIDYKISNPTFEEQADFLARTICKFSKEELGKIMNIKNNLLDETFHSFQSFDDAKSNPAICTYTGLVYKYMNISDYNNSMLDYLDEHLCILSALYGVLKPFDGIKPYRLDMKMTILEESLYKFWKERVITYFEGETILNLASNEFSKMITLPMITVAFREYKDEKYKNLATYSKMARGMLLDYIIKHQIEDIDSLREISFENYHYNASLSDDKTITFTRND
jgi:cytoplasmic iron level regulating protein YaaA (DUF328/UPF0246 family)